MSFWQNESHRCACRRNIDPGNSSFTKKKKRKKADKTWFMTLDVLFLISSQQFGSFEYVHSVFVLINAVQDAIFLTRAS